MKYSGYLITSVLVSGLIYPVFGHGAAQNAYAWDETHELLSGFRGLLQVVPLSIETHESGLELAERYNLSIYDALIAAAALQASCDNLWS